MKYICVILFICTFSIQLWTGESARFLRSGYQYAASLLDKSQGKQPFGLTATGHPRSHVLGLVEQYSRENGGLKTGFESTRDQNEVLKRMMSIRAVTNAINTLNSHIDQYKKVSKSNPNAIPRDYRVQAVTVSIYSLGYTNKNAPMTQGFINGIRQGRRVRCTSVTLLLAHWQWDANGEVFIYTMYPVV